MAKRTADGDGSASKPLKGGQRPVPSDPVADGEDFEEEFEDEYSEEEIFAPDDEAAEDSQAMGGTFGQDRASGPVLLCERF
jgi:ribosome assembly protein RRB1